MSNKIVDLIVNMSSRSDVICDLFGQIFILSIIISNSYEIDGGEKKKNTQKKTIKTKDTQILIETGQIKMSNERQIATATVPCGRRYKKK